MYTKMFIEFIYPAQDIFNNPFGDFNNQFISDVAIGKSTEITDLVMQQQPENAFSNLTDTMNSINNNKFNNGHDGNGFGADEESPMSQEADQSVLVLNDDNNNSNDNLGGPDMGPETDVDAIDEHFGFEAAAGAVGGEKEKLQMEFKETEDVADRADVMNFGEEHPAAMFGTLENKIFEEMSLHNPDLMKANNPFADNSIPEGIEPVGDFLDNKFEEEVQKAQHHVDNFADQMDQFQTESYDRAVDFVTESIENFTSSANQDVLEEALQHQLEAGESCIPLFHVIKRYFRPVMSEPRFLANKNREPNRYLPVRRDLNLISRVFWASSDVRVFIQVTTMVFDWN